MLKAILRRLIARLTDSINQAYDGASPAADESVLGRRRRSLMSVGMLTVVVLKTSKNILNISFEVRSQQTFISQGLRLAI